MEPKVPVELGVSEVLETSGPVPPAADVAETATADADTTGAASAAAGSVVGYCFRMQLESSSSCAPQSPGACARC